MSKPLLGLDLDGVLYHWTEAAIDTFNALRGLSITHYGEDPEWNFLKTKVSHADWEWLWNDREARRMCFTCGRPFADGLRAADELGQLFRVVILTSRPAEEMDVTMRWLGNMHVRPHALVHIALPDKKWHHELADRCVAFIDDNSDNARALRDAHPDSPMFVPARMYNRDVIGEEGITRFTDWRTVLDWAEEHHGD